MYKCSLTISLALLAGIATQGLASATTLFTPVQTVNYNFSSMNSSSTLLFNGFDTSLGTLTDVHLSYTLSETLHNDVANLTGITQSVGNPTPLSAKVNTAISGPGALLFPSLSYLLITPGFTGNVVNGSSVVGVNSISGLNSPVVIDSNPSDLALFIGGVNAIGIQFASSGTQNGSVPAGVFTGNSGSGSIDLKLDYSYTPSSATPEPSTLWLMGIPLAGLMAWRRNQQL